ncbi:MAG: hypothetical protein GAK36_00052 [Pseudomonas sp.]|nr:MAG: hypothetical protein GAK36_00052 [Pseudomonas sp.]
MPEENTKPWNGEGLPPVGTTCIVTPHNTNWGFERVEENRCRVLAYQYEFAWLHLLNSDDSESFVFITTRTDKVDFTPFRTPEQIAAEERETFIFNAVLETDAETPVEWRKAVFGEMFDLGYRKQVAP